MNERSNLSHTRTLVVKSRRHDDLSGRIIRTTAYIVTGIFTVLCMLPFILMVSASFSSEKAIVQHGFSFLPQEPTVFAYTTLFNRWQDLAITYLLTIGIALCGTLIGLFIVSMTAYALSRVDFYHRNVITMYIFFTMLFSGGLVPFYLLIVKYMHLNNNYLAILLPSLLSPFLIILMRNFIKSSIPHEITESGRIDGVGDFGIFIRLILPLSKPSLATVGLFIAIGYWNGWYNSMLFLRNTPYVPLQYFLWRTINTADWIRSSAAAAHVTVQNLPSETAKMATAVLTVVPILCVYPFVQRYFIKGITIGAVKG